MRIITDVTDHLYIRKAICWESTFGSPSVCSCGNSVVTYSSIDQEIEICVLPGCCIHSMGNTWTLHDHIMKLASLVLSSAQGGKLAHVWRCKLYKGSIVLPLSTHLFHHANTEKLTMLLTVLHSLLSWPCPLGEN